MIVIKNKAVINELRRMGFLNALQEENAPVDASKVAPLVVQAARDVKSKSESEAKKLIDTAKTILAELEADYKAIIDSRDFRRRCLQLRRISLTPSGSSNFSTISGISRPRQTNSPVRSM